MSTTEGVSTTEESTTACRDAHYACRDVHYCRNVHYTNSVSLDLVNVLNSLELKQLSLYLCKFKMIGSESFLHQVNVVGIRKLGEVGSPEAAQV